MPNRIDHAVRIASGAVVALSLIAGAAHAKPWVKLAPAPLASDSAYAALAARPSDSLNTDEFAWVDVQRDWRSQRAHEDVGDRRGITSDRFEHVSRPGDSRFAKLASQPFDSLGDRERSWLVVESAAQRSARAASGQVSAGTVIGVGLLAALAGAALGVWIVGSALSDGLDHMFGK